MSDSQDSTNSADGRNSGVAGRWLKRGLVLAAVAGIGVACFTFVAGANTPKTKGPKLLHKVSRTNLQVSVTEQGTLESSDNVEIKCRVKGGSTVLWVIEAGTEVKPGDVVVRLDQSNIEDTINQQRITYQNALATFAQSESNVSVAAIGITEYEDGIFRSALQTLEKDLAVAESNLRTSQNLLEHSRRMFKKGYISSLEVEGNEFSLKRANLELGLKKTEIDVLKRFTKAKELENLRAALKTAKARLASDRAALDLEKSRLERAEEQLKNCVIKAEAAGMVIHPSAAEWKTAPDIEEGANVREDQILLIIPDLSKMQVKVGIHESKIDRLNVGMEAQIDMQDGILDGEVDSIATVTRPAGWWTGNVVKYDTIIKIESRAGLKPGMSAAVKVILADYKDVVTVPVAAVVEEEEGFFCWVKIGEGETQRRALELGDTDDQYIIVKSGLKEGDDVVLNPLAYIDEAQKKALKPIRAGSDGNPMRSKNHKQSAKAAAKPEAAKPEAAKPGAGKPVGRQPAAGKPAKKAAKKAATPQVNGAALVKYLDKNKDGALSKEEFPADQQSKFGEVDANSDGKITASEIDASIKKAAQAGAK